METTTLEEMDKMTTMSPKQEFTTISPNNPIETTTKMEEETTTLSPTDLYDKYGAETPPFPLFQNVSAPTFSNLTPAKQNACSSAEIDYTKQIKEAAAYINQESYVAGVPIVRLPGRKKKPNKTIIEYDPVQKAASVVQQALNISNSNSLSCVCNNVSASISENEDSSEAIEFDISKVKTTNFTINVGQQSDQTTTVTNVLSESFTNTVNNSIKNNLNIFASQVNKV